MLKNLDDVLNTEQAIQWKAHLRVEVVDDKSIVVLNGDDCDVYTGTHFSLLAPLLDEGMALTQLFENLKGKLSPPEITYVLDYLLTKGLLAKFTSVDIGVAAFWHQYNLDPDTAENVLNTCSMQIVGSNGEVVKAIRASLAELGIVLSDNGNFKVVVVDDYLAPILSEINQQAQLSGNPWIVINLHGRELLIGPVFRAPESACWSCLEQRIKSNRQIETFLERSNITKNAGRGLPSHRSSILMGAAIAAQEILKAIAIGKLNDLSGSILAIDTLTMETTRHTVTKRPQCSVCGTGKLPILDKDEYLLTPDWQIGHEANGSRIVPPNVTFERLKKHVSHLTGVVRSLEVVGAGRTNGLTHSYTSGHNFALMQHDLRFALLNLRGRSGGKGTTDLEAKIGAVCEAVERYSGVYRGDEASITSSFEDLKQPAFLPNDLMLFSDAQFQGRKKWNRENSSGYHRVPEQFNTSDVIDWAPVYSLTHERFVQIPSAYCYFGHPQLQKKFFCSCDSNGNAAGNTKEEAIFQGLLELIERDSVCIWWYNMMQPPQIDIQSLQDPYVDQLQDFYHSIGRDFWLLDISGDLGVPVVAAVSRARDRMSEDIILGFGAHPSARLAAKRAITELNQFLPAVAKKDSSGRTLYWFPDQEAIQWWQNATIDSEKYLNPNTKYPVRNIDDLGTADARKVYDNLITTLAKLDSASLEVLVLNQTQPDVELNVVKVIVPGLRHFWKRFAPGRLYDVPVKLAWRNKILEEKDLNPNGIFF